MFSWKNASNKHIVQTHVVDSTCLFQCIVECLLMKYPHLTQVGFELRRQGLALGVSLGCHWGVIGVSVKLTHFTYIYIYNYNICIIYM
jgi:hypothetical protein